MPIVEKDPWREQYFEGVECPEDVIVPTDDELAWKLYPAHRWVYNKLAICESQGLPCAPHGIVPEAFPVFSKPIYNLRGMGTGGRLIETPRQFDREQSPGHLWMPLLEGEHVSTDVAVRAGQPVWWRHVHGLEIGGGMFNYWIVEAARRSRLERRLGEWIRGNLADYTGCLNVETIGGTIIEVHLRFADQWPDLYGEGWIESVVQLYARGSWSFEDADRRDGFSVVLFGGHRVRYRVDASVVEEVRRRPGISSVQITFHPDRPLKTHAMPPGGFRLAIVNAWELSAGLAARQDLANAFWARAGRGVGGVGGKA